MKFVLAIWRGWPRTKRQQGNGPIPRTGYGFDYGRHYG